MCLALLSSSAYLVATCCGGMAVAGFDPRPFGRDALGLTTLTSPSGGSTFNDLLRSRNGLVYKGLPVGGFVAPYHKDPRPGEPGLYRGFYGRLVTITDYPNGAADVTILFANPGPS